ncbi:hypothetical protein [Kaarinaea lacus]
MTTHAPMLISPLGLNDVEQKVLSVAVGLLSEDGINLKLLSNNDPTGDLAIIDSDSTDGQVLLENTKSSQIKLLFCSKPVSGKNLVSMPKPVRVAALKELLGKISNLMLNQAAKRQTNVNTKNAAETNQQTQKPASLFQTLLQAKQEQKCLFITNTTGLNLLINGGNKTATLSGDQNDIDQLIHADVSSIQIKEVNPDELSIHCENPNILAIDRILWQCGTAESRAELLPGHRLDKPVKLRAWPNFTRNNFNPVYLQLSAALAKEATSLQQLQEQCNVPLEEIIRFYNAAYAVDLIDRNPGKPEHQQQEAKPKSPKLASVLIGLKKRLGFR